MNHAYQIQSQLLTFPPPSVDPNLFAVKLIGICAANTNVRYGTLIFTHHLPNPNIFSYNALLKSFTQISNWDDTIAYFNELLSSPNGPCPDEYTFTSVLKACAGLTLIKDGEKIHCVVVKGGLDSNLFVKNSLIHMYFKLSCFSYAQKLFDEMQTKDMVSWNTMISGYSMSGDIGKARMVFDGMKEKSVVTWSTMITGLTRVGKVDEARILFDEMPERNIVSWNSMISGYSQNEKYSEAIELFREMQRMNNLNPNDVTLISVLSACAHLGALDLGKWIDEYVNRSGMNLGNSLGNALVDMYAKCGCILEAKRVFDTMKEKDGISYSIIITGYAMNGYADEAFEFFDEMIGSRIMELSDITFMGLLTACTHSGLVEKGLEYFNSMDKVYGITPTVEHYGCVVDLLSRAGRIEEAEKLIESMPMKPNVIVWGALLGGCQIYKDTEMGKRIVERILELDSDHSGSYIYLANVYASMGRLDEAALCRVRMQENSVMKIPGCSLRPG